jgi:hypothetical protein
VFLSTRRIFFPHQLWQKNAYGLAVRVEKPPENGRKKFCRFNFDPNFGDEVLTRPKIVRNPKQTQTLYPNFPIFRGFFFFGGGGRSVNFRSPTRRFGTQNMRTCLCQFSKDSTGWAPGKNGSSENFDFKPLWTWLSSSSISLVESISIGSASLL